MPRFLLRGAAIGDCVWRRTGIVAEDRGRFQNRRRRSQLMIELSMIDVCLVRLVRLVRLMDRLALCLLEGKVIQITKI